MRHPLWYPKVGVTSGAGVFVAEAVAGGVVVEDGVGRGAVGATRPLQDRTTSKNSGHTSRKIFGRILEVYIALPVYSRPTDSFYHQPNRTCFARYERTRPVANREPQALSLRFSLWILMP